MCQVYGRGVSSHALRAYLGPLGMAGVMLSAAAAYSDRLEGSIVSAFAAGEQSLGIWSTCVTPRRMQCGAFGRVMRISRCLRLRGACVT